MSTSAANQILTCQGQLKVDIGVSQNAPSQGAVKFVGKVINTETEFAAMKVYGSSGFGFLLLEALNSKLQQGFAIRTNAIQGGSEVSGGGEPYIFRAYNEVVEMKNVLITNLKSSANQQTGQTILTVNRSSTEDSSTIFFSHALALTQGAYKAGEGLFLGVGGSNIYAYYGMTSPTGSASSSSNRGSLGMKIGNAYTESISFASDQSVNMPGTLTVNTINATNYVGYPTFDPLPITLDQTNNRVGINTTSPTEALDVVGNAKVSGTMTADTVSATTYVGLPVVSFAPITRDTVNNRIGINQVTPTEALDVVGNAKVSGTMTADTISATTYIGLPPVVVPASELLPITLDKVNNRVGINNTTPTVAFDIGGDIALTGRLATTSTKVGIGSLSGSISQGTNCVAIGNNAGYNIQGNSSVAIGNQAGYSSQSATCVAIGANAGQTIQGTSSVAIGNLAGYNQQSNTAVSIGSNAGYTLQAVSGVAIGNSAGYNTQGLQSVAIGSSAGTSLQGTNSIGIGTLAGGSSQGNNAVAIGYEAARFTQSLNSVAVGNESGRSNQGSYSVAVGHAAARSGQGAGCVAIGSGAAFTSQGALSIAIGNNAGQNQSTNAVAIGNGAASAGQGTDCIAIGNAAGQTNQSGYSVALGGSAGYQFQSVNAVAIGSSAGFNAQGIQCVAIGRNAGNTGQNSYSIAIGPDSGKTNQLVHAVAVGNSAGQTSQGEYGISIGYFAGNSGQGNSSIAIGNAAGQTNQHANSIILNATGSALNSDGTSRTYVAPVREVANNKTVQYNATTKEVTYTDTLVTTGTGSPEGAITAPVGRLFLRTNGDAETTMYVKISGTGNTGWAPVRTNSSPPSWSIIRGNTGMTPVPLGTVTGYTTDLVSPIQCTVNKTAGTVTITTPGRYYISFSGFSELTSNTYASYEIRVNNVMVVMTFNGDVGGTVPHHFSGSISCICELNINDVVSIYTTGTVALYPDSNCSFCGYMIR